MAETIRPWLALYLVSIGEEYGGQLSNVPRQVKKKKVQLVEYLTYGNDNDDRIWAKISDKQYRAPICFTKVALEEFGRVHGNRLTEYKTAIITIKDFRVIFTRIPLGGGRKGISQDAYLAFECNYLTIVGSIDEAEWGSPKDIHEDSTIREWIEGLRRDGGGGNILRERKKGRDEQQTNDTAVQKMPYLQQARIKIPNHGARKETAGSSTRTMSNEEMAEHGQELIVSPMTEYRRSWKHLERIADKVVLHAPSPKSHKSLIKQDSMPVEIVQTPHTPKRREPSQKRSAIPTDEQQSLDEKADSRRRQLSSPITTWSPTPDRRNQASHPSWVSDHGTNDVMDVSVEREVDEENSAPVSPDKLLPSPQSSPTMIPATLPTSSMLFIPNTTQPTIQRKVPKPLHVIRTTTDHIVAPDSDMSYSMSQPLTESQSHSQSQSGSQMQATSQFLVGLQVKDVEHTEIDNDSHDSLFSGSDSEENGEKYVTVDSCPSPEEDEVAANSETDDDGGEVEQSLVKPIRLPSSSPTIDVDAAPADDIREHPKGASVQGESVFAGSSQRQPASTSSPSAIRYIDGVSSERDETFASPTASQPISSKDGPTNPATPFVPHEIEEWRVPSFMRRSGNVQNPLASDSKLHKDRSIHNQHSSPPPKRPRLIPSSEKPLNKKHRKLEQISSRSGARKQVAWEEPVKEEEQSQSLEVLTKLKGFELQLTERVTSDKQLKWCDWDRVGLILLATGQARTSP